MQYIPIILRTSKSNLFQQIADANAVNTQNIVEIEGVGILSNITIKTVPSLTEGEIIISFMIGVASNFATDALKAWLSNTFLHEETKIYIGDDPIRKSTPAEIQDAIDNELDKHSED